MWTSRVVDGLASETVGSEPASVDTLWKNTSMNFPVFQILKSSDGKWDTIVWHVIISLCRIWIPASDASFVLQWYCTALRSSSYGISVVNLIMSSNIDGNNILEFTHSNTSQLLLHGYLTFVFAMLLIRKRTLLSGCSSSTLNSNFHK